VRYNWPGNIRELENAIERAALLAEGAMITSTDLRLGDFSPGGSGSRDSQSVVKIPPTGIALEDIERQAITEALKMANWVQKDAAELLQISPRVMNYKIKTLGIDSLRPRRRQTGIVGLAVDCRLPGCRSQIDG
jgi:DNA-binding NtrC family response regulator